MMHFRQYALRWPLYMTALFCVYTLILLWNVFSTQAQLRASTDVQLISDSQRRGDTLAEYANDRRKRVMELAVSNEIEVYLANKALGMSEKYGLFANLTAIEELFKKEILSESMGCREIIYFDENHEPLTEAFASGSVIPVPAGVREGVRFLIDEQQQAVITSAPVIFKGRYQGAVVMSGDLDQLSRLLNAELGDENHRKHEEILVSADGFSLTAKGSAVTLQPAVARHLAQLPENVLVRLADVPGLSPDQADRLALRTAVQGMPLFLVSLIDLKGAYGHLISRVYLYTFGSFPFLLFFGVVVLERQRQNAEKLQSDNAALANEIARRSVLEQELREKSERLEQLAVEFEMIALRAEDASTAKSQFLANMSHELRTPMNAILGMSYLVLQSELPAKQREQLTYLNNAAESLLATISDILDFSNVEAGKMTLAPAPFVLKDELEEVIERFKPKWEEKWLEFRYEQQDQVLAQDAPLLIGDGARLRQVLANLFSNTVKFTDNGFVRLGVSSSPSEQGTRVTFTVQDSGIGMSSEQMAKLFEGFSQGDVSSTREYGGTGLGLAIAHGLVTLMGGKIEVASQPGQGSCFTVAIPFELAPADAVPIKERRKDLYDFTALAGIRVLLVEDNPVNRLLTRELLTRKGMVVELAGDGGEALDILRNHPAQTYEAVLMDLEMPVLDGYEAARIIRSDSKFTALPIIALSSHAMPAEKEQCLQIGMNGYINKPFHPELLWRTLLRAIRKNVVFPAASLLPPAFEGMAIDPGVAIDGVNFQEALKRTEGDPRLYAKVVAEIVGNFSGGCAALLEFAEQKNAKGGHDYAHMLRGMFGAIAAEEMEKSLAIIEEIFRSGLDPRAQILALNEAYDALMEALRGYLRTTSVSSSAADDQDREGTAAFDPAWFEAFIACLEKGDFKVLELWENRRHTLLDRYSSRDLERIDRALKNFDFALALTTLKPPTS